MAFLMQLMIANLNMCALKLKGSPKRTCATPDTQKNMRKRIPHLTQQHDTPWKG